MTVCIAAFAAESKAILLASDKALTFGDNVYRPAMQADTGVTKLISVKEPCWYSMVAGNPSFAEKVIAEAQTSIKDVDYETVTGLRIGLTKAFVKIRDEAIDESILKRRLLTKELLLARDSSLLPLDKRFFREVTSEVNNFNSGCTLLVSGFDKNGNPHIFTVDEPGSSSIHDLTGYHAIGIGSEIAIGRLLNSEVDRNEELASVLFDIFDAKAQAELIQGVGYATDVFVLTARGKTEVNKKMRTLLDKAFEQSNRSPFAEPLGRGDRPPKNWKEQLRSYLNGILQSQG